MANGTAGLDPFSNIISPFGINPKNLLSGLGGIFGGSEPNVQFAARDRAGRIINQVAGLNLQFRGKGNVATSNLVKGVSDSFLFKGIPFTEEIVREGLRRIGPIVSKTREAFLNLDPRPGSSATVRVPAPNAAKIQAEISSIRSQLPGMGKNRFKGQLRIRELQKQLETGQREVTVQRRGKLGLGDAGNPELQAKAAIEANLFDALKEIANEIKSGGTIAANQTVPATAQAPAQTATALATPTAPTQPAATLAAPLLPTVSQAATPTAPQPTTTGTSQPTTISPQSSAERITLESKFAQDARTRRRLRRRPGGGTRITKPLGLTGGGKVFLGV